MMITNTSEAIDPLVLRRALGNFATGVTVVTASHNNQKTGITANSFSSVSLDPPLILWSLDKRSKSFNIFRLASHFAVNILAMGQIELSNRFAKPTTNDRFDGVECTRGLGNSILLPGTSASFECAIYAIHDGGDHWVIMGQVECFKDHGKDPLLYHQGAYSTVLPHPYLQTGRDKQHNNHNGILNGRLNNHPYYLLTRALRCYQENYKPAQQKIGWRPDEARLLMLLDDNPYMDIKTLTREADMPQHQVAMTLDILLSRNLIQINNGYYQLTDYGTEWVSAIWDLAQKQEEKIFTSFNESEIYIFKKILKSIINEY